MLFNLGQDVLPHEYKGEIYNRESAGRLWLLRWVFAFLFIVFAARTLEFGLQSSDIDRGVRQNEELKWRADIVDRNGVVLAKSVKAANIKLLPPRVKDKDTDAVARIISTLVPDKYSVEDALRLIRSGKRGVYIKMNASEEETKFIEQENKKYNCFESEKFAKRVYPQRNVFAHVVGFVGKENTGLAGAEYKYDEYLSENRDALRLSIDSRVQNIFHEQLMIAMDKYNAKGAMGMLMNSSTGEMIAMVQLPDFDPSNFETASKDVRKNKLLLDNLEMGSVFKIFNTALAYENGLQNKSYRIDEPFKIYDKRNRLVKSITDHSSFTRNVVKEAGIHSMKAPDIMLYSCNVGSAYIAKDLPEGAQKNFFHRLHFDKALQLEFGKTAPGIIHRSWGPVEKATASFGHGITVTPIHLLLAINAMTNGGIYIEPTLFKRSIGAIRGERVLDPEISANLRKIMFRIAEETTAKKARVQGVEIGGKTGTAEKRHPDGTPDKTRNRTVFTGIFPVSAPQYIILIILDEPKGNVKTAAWNAVPTAGAILDDIIPLLFE